MIGYMGFDPKTILVIGFYMAAFVYPLFFIITFFSLKSDVRKDIDTVFYLLVPLIINIPFWTYILEYLSEFL